MKGFAALTALLNRRLRQDGQRERMLWLGCCAPRVASSRGVSQCYHPHESPEVYYTAMSKALNATGHPMWFNTCEWYV